ncbi:MAG: hypothetical protein ACJAS2_000737 [Pseudohongiellaceae bacterium]|jgi:hypothetical protein
MKKVIALYFLVVTNSIFAQQSISTYDASTGILRVPNLVYDNTVYDYLDLEINASGTLDILEVGPTGSSSGIPVDATFVFVDSNTLMVPVIEFDGGYFYNVELSITADAKLAIGGLETQSSELLYRDGDVTSIESAIVVSSNINSIRYPESFQNVSSLPIDLVEPQCDLTPSTIVYPADWIGDLGLPVIQGAPFAEGPELTIALKDFWQEGNPTFNNGCSGNVRDNFRLLVQRVKTLNATTIEFTPWTFIDDRTSTWTILNTDELIAETGTSVPTDDDIVWMTQVAHENGLKIHWRNQIQGNLSSEVPAETIENMEKFIPAYEAFMLERADFLNGIGVDAMQFDCICWFAWYTDNEVTSLYQDSLETLALEIDNRFDGKLYTEHQGLYLSRDNIINTTDEIFIDLSGWIELSTEEQMTLEPSSIKTRTLQAIESAFSLYPQEVLDRVTVLFEISSPSRYNFFEKRDSLEETFCTSGLNTISQQGDSCIQRSEKTDFSSQARVVEGMLEALKEQTRVPNFHVAAQGYWPTQPVLDGSSFPNIAYSVRNKPAEKILQIWFER